MAESEEFNLLAACALDLLSKIRLHENKEASNEFFDALLPNVLDNLNVLGGMRNENSIAWLNKQEYEDRRHISWHDENYEKLCEIMKVKREIREKEEAVEAQSRLTVAETIARYTRPPQGHTGNIEKSRKGASTSSALDDGGSGGGESSTKRGKRKASEVDSESSKQQGKAAKVKEEAVSDEEEGIDPDKYYSSEEFEPKVRYVKYWTSNGRVTRVD